MPARPESLEEARRRTNEVMHRHGHDLDEVHDANPLVEVVPNIGASLDSQTTLEEMFGKEKAALLRRGAKSHDAIDRKKLPDY